MGREEGSLFFFSFPIYFPTLSPDNTNTLQGRKEEMGGVGKESLPLPA